MKTKLELIQAAQSAAAASLSLHKQPDIEAARKQAFDALGIHKDNWRFFSEHFNGARTVYAHNEDAPIEGLPKEQS